MWRDAGANNSLPMPVTQPGLMYGGPFAGYIPVWPRLPQQMFLAEPIAAKPSVNGRFSTGPSMLHAQSAPSASFSPYLSAPWGPHPSEQPEQAQPVPAAPQPAVPQRAHPSPRKPAPARELPAESCRPQISREASQPQLASRRSTPPKREEGQPQLWPQPTSRRSTPPKREDGQLQPQPASRRSTPPKREEGQPQLQPQPTSRRSTPPKREEGQQAPSSRRSTPLMSGRETSKAQPAPSSRRSTPPASRRSTPPTAGRELVPPQPNQAGQPGQPSQPGQPGAEHDQATLLVQRAQQAMAAQYPRSARPSWPAREMSGRRSEPGLETEQTLMELKHQIGSLRKDLHVVRENVDAQLQHPEEQRLANVLRTRMNSLCSELADCGIEALHLCANLGHRSSEAAVLRSRSAPGGHVWRQASQANAPMPCAFGCPGTYPIARMATSPPLAFAFNPNAGSPSPRLARASAEPVTNSVFRSFSQPREYQHSRAQSGTSDMRQPSAQLPLQPPSPVNVLTAAASTSSLGSSFLRPLVLPMGATVMTKGSLGGPLSPKETLTRPRAPSPGPPGPLLSRFERDAITCDSCGNRLADEMDMARPEKLAEEERKEKVLNEVCKMAGRRAGKLKERLMAATAKVRSRSTSIGPSKKQAMDPVREGSPFGNPAQWHKPGRIPSYMKESGGWSPRRPSRHWTSENLVPLDDTI
ncbi:unnamed protein product [Effrenium voratum]|nr:unnamed protein product [Effrenium voratum]